MIPNTKQDANVIDNRLATERAAFTISNDPKAFRALIDGIYQNKLSSMVRELMSNAADSHAAAGHNRQFHVHVVSAPGTTWNGGSELSVRDFGVGMTHEEVMSDYTTMFKSTKEGTNTQTGMLGLGAKSPFAVVDSFVVQCYDGTTCRTYAMSMENGIPTVSLVATTESDESGGVCVSVRLPSKQVSGVLRVVEEMAVPYALDTRLPNVAINGKRHTVDVDLTVRSKTCVAYVVSGGSDTRALIKQGSVLYPVPGWCSPFSKVPYGKVVVYDVPIGTSDFNVGREALADDDTSKEALRECVGSLTSGDFARAFTARYGQFPHSNAVQSINYVDVADRAVLALGRELGVIPNRIDIANPHGGMRFVSGDNNKWPSFPETFSMVTTTAATWVMVRRDDKTYKWKVRYYAKCNGTVAVLTEELLTDEQLIIADDLKRRERLLYVEDLPAPPRARPSAERSNASRQTRGIKKLRKLLDDGAPWANVMYGKFTHQSPVHLANIAPCEQYRQRWSVYAVEEPEGFVYLTNKQVETLNPPAENRVDRLALSEFKDEWVADIERAYVLSQVDSNTHVLWDRSKARDKAFEHFFGVPASNVRNSSSWARLNRLMEPDDGRDQRLAKKVAEETAEFKAKFPSLWPVNIDFDAYVEGVIENDRAAASKSA